MKKSVFVALIAFSLGTTFGVLAAKKSGVTAAAWQGVSNEAAAANLLEVARDLAEDGSWENIHCGRVLYLSGDKEKAAAIFDRYQSKPDDLIRIARVYAQAREWDKAKPLFDQVVSMAPKDEDWLIEAGAFYNLNGDREHAEELFSRGFAIAPKNLDNTLDAAGSYLGVPPRKR